MFPFKKAFFNMTFEATLLHFLYYLSVFCRFGDHNGSLKRVKLQFFSTRNQISRQLFEVSLQ